jgi:hypothetical protein
MIKINKILQFFFETDFWINNLRFINSRRDINAVNLVNDLITKHALKQDIQITNRILPERGYFHFTR